MGARSGNLNSSDVRIRGARDASSKIESGAGAGPVGMMTVTGILLGVSVPASTASSSSSVASAGTESSSMFGTTLGVLGFHSQSLSQVAFLFRLSDVREKGTIGYGILA